MKKNYINPINKIVIFCIIIFFAFFIFACTKMVQSNDEFVEVRVDNVTVIEGQIAEVKISLNKKYLKQIFFNYETTTDNNKSAVPDLDYQHKSGFRSIFANTLFSIIQIETFGDNLLEKDEKFKFLISINNPDIKLIDKEAIVTIENDHDQDGIADKLDLDIDGDGLPNKDEIANCDASMDCDGDDLIDSKELKECMLSEDCDQDKILDKEELAGCMNLADCDRDGIIDSSEEEGCIKLADCDGDGMNDLNDKFPSNPYETLDTDLDGVGDNSDAFPKNNKETLDTDLDGIGNNADEDDDNDKILDKVDNCPLDVNVKQSDLDKDKAGDICDLDVDNDGLIEIHNLEMLYNIRYVLDGSGYKENIKQTKKTEGCLGCIGYELSRNLDFQDANSYASKIVNKDWVPDYEDIDLASNKGWKPIGSKKEEFNAIFNGNNYIISNLYINDKKDNLGLFGAIIENANIQNLGIIKSYVRGNDFIGGIVGVGVCKFYVSCGIISNSYTDIQVFAENWGGGLIGRNLGLVENSYTLGSTVVKRYYAGGLVGLNYKGAIRSSYSRGIIKSRAFSGGLVGINSGSISNSYSNTSVEAFKVSGGLVGYNVNGSVVNSYTLGAVSSEKEYSGGLIGYNGGGVVINNYSLSNVIADKYVGALIGWNSSGTVNNSYRDIDAKVKGQDKNLIGTGLNLIDLKKTCPDNIICQLGSGFKYNSVAGKHYPHVYKEHSKEHVVIGQ